MSGIVQKVVNVAARTYQGMVSKKLAAFGLKLEDCYVETPGNEHIFLIPLVIIISALMMIILIINFGPLYLSIIPFVYHLSLHRCRKGFKKT